MMTVQVFGREVAVLPLDDESVIEKFNRFEHQYMTCRNHPEALYLTKNPAYRTLHFVRPAMKAMQEAKAAGSPWPSLECPCPYGDLVVLPDGDPASDLPIGERMPI